MSTRSPRPLEQAIASDMFRKSYGEVFTGDEELAHAACAHG